MIPTAPLRDPTDVLGRRFGAAIIDALLGLLLIPVAVLIVAPTAWDRVDTPSNAAALDRCDRFNGTGPYDNYADADGPSAPRPDPVQDGHRNDRGFCVPVGDGAYYVEASGLVRAMLLLQVVLLVPALLNEVVLQRITGGSIGKLCTGVRVVRPDGSIAGFWRQLVRWLCFRAEGGLIGIILICVTKGHRRIGDMLANTLVVGKADVGAPILVAGLTVPEPPPPPYGGYGYPPYGSTPPPYPPAPYPPAPYPPAAYPPAPSPAPPAAPPTGPDGPHLAP
ncbi:MAG: RDD family protein [Acidimicrobiales bacterium]